MKYRIEKNAVREALMLRTWLKSAEMREVGAYFAVSDARRMKIRSVKLEFGGAQ